MAVRGAIVKYINLLVAIVTLYATYIGKVSVVSRAGRILRATSDNVAASRLAGGRVVVVQHKAARNMRQEDEQIR